MGVQTFYDAYWASGLHVSPEWSEAQFQRWMSPLAGKESVLDYGCGMGYAYQRHLAKAVQNYTGADAGPKAVADARSKGFATLEIDPDTGAIAAPDEAFDGVSCIEVLEHLFDPLQSAREIFRVLKPGGVLVATVPNFGYLPWRLMALLRAQVPSEPEDPKVNRHNGVHIRYFSRLTFRRLMRDAGFTGITVGSFDDASIWDISAAAGPMARVRDLARRHLPAPFHLRFLQDLWPNVFAIRLRAVAYKP